MLKRWLGAMTLKELMTRTWRETNEDDVFSHAAQLAYYFLLALFPMLIFLSSLIGFLPEAQANIFRGLAKIMPGEALNVVSLVLASLVFSLYLRFGPSYSATYGSLGAVNVLMLWLYVMGIVVLIGGEINSEIRQENNQAVRKGNTVDVNLNQLNLAAR